MVNDTVNDTIDDTSNKMADTDAPSECSRSATVQLAMELMAKPSVTPDDCDCQTIMCERLQAIGFRIEPLRYGEVDNFWARRGDSGPLFAFAGQKGFYPH